MPPQTSWISRIVSGASRLNPFRAQPQPVAAPAPMPTPPSQESTQHNGFISIDKNGKAQINANQEYLQRLANVLTSGRKQFIPFKYAPQVFDAREDQLLYLKKYEIIDQMYRDPVIRRAINDKVTSAFQGHSTQPNDAKDPVSCLAADLCIRQMKDLEGGFFRSLKRQAKTFVLYGFAVQEPEWTKYERGKWAGMERLSKFNFRLPHFLEPTDSKEEPGEIEILQKNPDNPSKPHKVMARDVLYWVWQGEIDPYKGEGDPRACYDRWWAKDTIIKLMAVHMEAFASGKPMVGFDIKDGQEITKEQIQHAEKIVSKWNEILAFMLLPGLKVDVVQSTQSSGDHYIAVIEFLNGEIRNSIGSAKLLSDPNGSTGSYALADKQGDHQSGTSGSDLQLSIEQMVKEKIYIPILRRNGIPDDHCPIFSLTPPQSKDREAQARLYYDGLDKKALKSREGDEDWLRSIIEAPSVEEAGDAIITQEGAPAAAAASFSRRKASPRPVSRYGFGELTERLGELIAERYGVQPPMDEVQHFERTGQFQGLATYAREVSNPFPKLDALQTEAEKEIGQVLAQELWRLLSSFEATFLDDSLDPEEKLDAAAGFTFNSDRIASSAASWIKDAWEIGTKSAEDEIPSVGRYAASSVNPAGLEGFKSLLALMRSKLQGSVAGLASDVNGGLLGIIQTAFKNREDWKETRSKLVDMLFAKTGIQLGFLKPDVNAIFPTPVSLTRQIKEAFAETANQARFEAYKRNPDFIAGYERDEVMGGKEPGRSHPLSKFVHGLMIPMTHPLADKFVGVLHYGDRGGIRNISRLRASRPDFKGWSTDAQIRGAYLKMQTLSPDFA